MGYKATLQEYLINSKAPTDVLNAMRSFDEYSQELEAENKRLEKHIEELESASLKVLQDCEAVGVEPFGARKLRDLLPEEEGEPDYPPHYYGF